MSRPMFLLERNHDHARLILNRPEARNAIPLAGWTELADVIARVAASDARRVNSPMAFRRPPQYAVQASSSGQYAPGSKPSPSSLSAAPPGMILWTTV